MTLSWACQFPPMPLLIKRAVVQFVGMRITPWSQRALAFGKGPEELVVLLERLRGTAARLFDLTAHVPLECLSLRTAGTWSVKEHIAHLIHLQDRFEERVEDFIARRPELCWIDLADQDVALAKRRTQPLGDLIEEFRLKRAYFIQRVSDMDPATLRHRAYHACQRISMTPVDMVLYTAEHDDHHLAAIRRILHQD